MPINVVDFIVPPTVDHEAARKFYGDVLGLLFSKRWDSMPPASSRPATVTIAGQRGEPSDPFFRRCCFEVQARAARRMRRAETPSGMA